MESAHPGGGGAMTGLWGAITGWFKAHNITSHTVAGCFLAFLGAFARDQELRNLVIGLIGNHPVIVMDLVTASGIYLKYSGSHSASGILGEVPGAQRTLDKEAPPKD